MITRSFIEKIHAIFDEMDYHPSDGFDFNEWHNAMVVSYAVSFVLEKVFLRREIDKANNNNELGQTDI